MARPRKELNPQELEKLIRIGCTDRELASYFEVNIDTIYERKKEPAYKAIFENTMDQTRVSLRRKQLEKAMQGNTAMLIWLGKVFLGQKETIAQQHGAMDGAGITEFTLKFGHDDGKEEDEALEAVGDAQ